MNSADTLKNTERTVAKNVSVLMISQVITWGLSILLTIFLPRYLGPAAIGKFHLANSLWAMVIVFATFGMDLLLTKEIARDGQKSPALVGTSIFLRSMLYALGSVVVVIYAHLAGYPAETRLVIYVVGAANLIVLVNNTYEAAINGMERMEYASLGRIITKILLTLISIAVLLLGGDVVLVAAVGILAAAINLLLLFRFMRRLQSARLQISRQLIGWLLKASFPYLMMYIFLVFYQQIDIVIISLLVSEEGIGWYGAADQLFGTLLFIPSVFMTAVFPALSRMFANEPDALPKLMRKSFNLLLILGVPIGLGLMVIANQLVVLLFGAAFDNSGPILAVMGIVLLLTNQNMLLGYFLVSIDRQKYMIWIMAAATLATIPLDLVLIPWCQATFGNGAIGGAIAFIITEIGITLTTLRLLPKGTLGKSDLWLAGRALLAGLVMVAVVWWTRQLMFVIPVALGAVVYIGLILLMRVIPGDDFLLMKSLAAGLLARLHKQPAQPIQ